MKFTCTTHRVVCQPEVNSAVDDLMRPNSSSRTLAFSPDWAEGRTLGMLARHASTHTVNWGSKYGRIRAAEGSPLN